jgi:hypothetical protein
MQQLSPRPDRSRDPLMRRLDSAAGRINPLLMMIAIGLAVLDASCLIALLDTGSLATSRGGPSPTISAPATGGVPN